MISVKHVHAKFQTSASVPKIMEISSEAKAARQQTFLADLCLRPIGTGTTSLRKMQIRVISVLRKFKVF